MMSAPSCRCRGKNFVVSGHLQSGLQRNCGGCAAAGLAAGGRGLVARMKVLRNLPGPGRRWRHVNAGRAEELARVFHVVDACGFEETSAKPATKSLDW